MPAQIQTVQGPLSADHLGITLMHEHVMVDFAGADQAGPHRYDVEEVFRVFGENTERLRGLLLDVVAALPEERDCPCAHALDGLTLPVDLP